MANPVRRRLRTRDEATSEAELLQLFREDPGALLHTFGDTGYRWPEPGPTPASPPSRASSVLPVRYFPESRFEMVEL